MTCPYKIILGKKIIKKKIKEIVHLPRLFFYAPSQFLQYQKKKKKPHHGTTNPCDVHINP